MIEKVNPSHPDKIADRIAGALVDYAYSKAENPKIAVEVLIGHGKCYIISETSIHIPKTIVQDIVNRIANRYMELYYNENMQDYLLFNNQIDKIRCGDNGIFKGAPITPEQYELSYYAKELYEIFGSDGKYILNDEDLIICQSNATNEQIEKALKILPKDYTVKINPLGFWTGGLDVDTGATNRKLGSDMGDGVTGGGLHGKDLSKADVSINIYLFLMAQRLNTKVSLYCAIGDEYVDEKPYSEIVKIAHDYIDSIGGFEKFAEWGLF